MTGNKAIRLLEEGRPTGSLEGGGDGHMMWLPKTQLLCFIAGSLLLAASLLFFTYTWITVDSDTDVTVRFSSPTVDSVNIDAFLPMLLQDLKRQGLFKPEDRAVFLGNPSSSTGRKSMLMDRTVDFIFAADGFGGLDFSFTDRVLKVGGIIAVRLGGEPSQMPPNYRLVYIQRFGFNVVAVATRKMYHADGNAAESTVTRLGRRLVKVSEAQDEAVDGLEEVPLEPPVSRRSGKHRTRYLPQWDGSLHSHPRLVFVDVGSPGRPKSEDWFKKHYPAMNQEFEIIRLNVEEKGRAEYEGITEWLARNVKEEEYVVMKAEAEVVEEAVREGAIGLVDELFLECRHQWEKGKKGLKSRRAYWECLALYGKLKDGGVVVHQWWG